MEVVPPLVALPGVNVKLTALPDKFNDSPKVAVRATVWAGVESSAAAEASVERRR